MMLCPCTRQLAAEGVEHSARDVSAVGAGEVVPAGQRGEHVEVLLGVVPGEQAREGGVDLVDAVAPAEVPRGVGVHQQVVADPGHPGQRTQPGDVVVGQPLLVPAQAAVELPHLVEPGAGEELLAEHQRLVVAHQHLHLPGPATSTAENSALV